MNHRKSKLRNLFRQEPCVAGFSHFLLILATLLFAQSAIGQGTVIVDVEGFESPLFLEGDLFGQQEWTSSGDGTSTAMVEAGRGIDGSQGLTVRRGPNSDYRWALPVTGFPTGDLITVSWDMSVTIDSGAEAFGPVFGVEAYDGAGGLGVLGLLGVDSSNGELIYQDEDSGFLLAAGPRVASDAWNQFAIEFDFSRDVYQGYLNGNLVVDVGFVDRGQWLDDFTDADISTIAAGGDPVSRARTGVAIYDNFIVYEGPFLGACSLGDIDCDGLLNATDIDLLAQAIRDASTASEFDLNDDALVNTDDLAVLVGDLIGTLPGDADLNLSVQFADFLRLSANFGNQGGWGSGDFDGSGDVQFADFLLLSANFGKSAVTAAVPEPNQSRAILLMAGVSVLLAGRRQH